MKGGKVITLGWREFKHVFNETLVDQSLASRALPIGIVRSWFRVGVEIPLLW